MNIDPRRLADSLRVLHPEDDRDISEALNQILKACVGLFGTTGAGLMVADQQNTLRYAAASDFPGRILEDVQSATGQGPCVDTFVLGRPVHTVDLAEETRWPDSRDVVVEHGIRAVLGVPVLLGAITVGSLDVYLDQPHDWDDSELHALSEYSTVLSTALHAALSARHSSELADQLQYALDYRVVIERAIGYLMGARRLDAVSAFNLLRRSSRNQRRKIAEVAQQLLDTGELSADPRA